MAPNTDHVVSSQPSDIRVPPIFITDPCVFRLFPELTPQCESLHIQCSLGAIDAALDDPDQIEVPRQETALSPSMVDVKEDSNEYFFEDLFQDDSFMSEEANENHKYSPVPGTADDLFDSDYVLPASTDWWELSPSEFDLVEIPHFSDSVNSSDLWEDVDTFVSVVDISCDDVTDAREGREPVYILDRKVTTVWGLDIIWEEEE